MYQEFKRKTYDSKDIYKNYIWYSYFRRISFLYVVVRHLNVIDSFTSWSLFTGITSLKNPLNRLSLQKTGSYRAYREVCAKEFACRSALAKRWIAHWKNPGCKAIRHASIVRKIRKPDEVRSNKIALTDHESTDSYCEGWNVKVGLLIPLPFIENRMYTEKESGKVHEWKGMDSVEKTRLKQRASNGKA